VTLARTFFWFGAAAVIFDVTTTFAPPLLTVQKSIVPFTGWVASAPYIFALGMWPGLLDRGRAQMGGPELRRHLRFTAWLLCFYAAFGAFMFLSGGPDYSYNPWLRVGVWQPLWTVLVPGAWAGFLLWCVRWPERRVEPGATGESACVDQRPS
jgi:hypothetical protein